MQSKTVGERAVTAFPMHKIPFFLSALYYKQLKASIFSSSYFLSSQKKQERLDRTCRMRVSNLSTFRACFAMSISRKCTCRPYTKWFFSNLSYLVALATKTTSYSRGNMHLPAAFTKVKSEKNDLLFHQYRWLTVIPETLSFTGEGQLQQLWKLGWKAIKKHPK